MTTIDLTYLAAFGTFFVAVVPIVWAMEWLGRMVSND